MKSGNRGYNEEDASLGDLSILGGQLVHDVLLIALPHRLSIKDLANLCLTSFAFREIFKQAIADQLLALVMDVNHLCKNIHTRLKLIERMINADPELMFMKARARSICMSPCEYIFAYPDVYLQTQFINAAFNHDLLDSFIEQSSNQPCLINIEQLRSLFTEHINLLNIVRQQAREIIDHPNDDEETQLANQMKLAITFNSANELARTAIAHAEIDGLPRCVLDEAIKPDIDTDEFKRPYNDPTPPAEYHLYDDGEGEFEPRFIDLLEYVDEPGKPSEVDFILSSSRFQDGKLAVRHRSPTDIEAVKRDQNYVLTLFDKCLEKCDEHKETAKFFQKIKKGKK